VKDAFREAARTKEFEILTKKPVVAEEQEQMRNPRSRSAKMRVAEKV
jgi:16S rRNA (cytosine1402-N4)-methyltransferase